MMLDVFTADAFNVINMTTAINKLPYVPNRLGQMNLFTEKPTTATVAVVEYAYGKLSLLGSAARGTRKSLEKSKKRNVKTFEIPHVPNNSVIKAEDVQGIRAFGSESELETVAAVVNDRLEQMRQSHEVTHEFHRAGAISGRILDADGSELLDLYDAFGITEGSYSLNFSGNDAGQLKVEIRDIIRDIENQLGAEPYKGIHAMCDDVFYDNLLKAPGVQEAYDRWQDGQFKRDMQGRNDGGFTWCGVTWENYRGKVGAQNFLQASNTARFFPVGVKDLFECHVAPADYMETVNTKGKLLYAKQERLAFDKGIELESQSNALFICTRPSTLMVVTST
jgi:hypothetical protein